MWMLTWECCDFFLWRNLALFPGGVNQFLIGTFTPVSSLLMILYYHSPHQHYTAVHAVASCVPHALCVTFLQQASESLDQLLYMCQTDTSHSVKKRAKETLLSFGEQRVFFFLVFLIKLCRSSDENGHMLKTCKYVGIWMPTLIYETTVQVWRVHFTGACCSCSLVPQNSAFSVLKVSIFRTAQNFCNWNPLKCCNEIVWGAVPILPICQMNSCLARDFQVPVPTCTLQVPTLPITFFWCFWKLSMLVSKYPPPRTLLQQV